ncbi:tetratricopeptide repeat protein [Streptomyces sp. NPDC051051]|uniref:tetratricopeptide repeat protein n=1 Tax=Streptomyces sp. NPDC051051 TaxID=3155666 RepID=UPI00342DFA19
MLHRLALPRDLHDFTARAPALARLRELAERLDPAHPPVAVVSGQPGLGKTAFAVHAAEQLAEEDEPAETAAAQDRTARWVLRRTTAAALHFDADHQGAPGDDPDPATAPADNEQARSWLEAERDQWLAALGRSRTAGRHQEVIDAAEAMHWFSDRTLHWELWAEVFQQAVDSARALGSRRDEAVQLNYLAWAYNQCLFDPDAALSAAEAALEAAREVADQLQVGWALIYAAGALNRLGRTDEATARFQESADHLSNQSGAQSRLAELTALNSLGRQLRQSGRATEALAIHRRSEAICRAGIPGKPAELIGLYLASVHQHIGNDLAALHRWAEAEAPLRYALSRFESARKPDARAAAGAGPAGRRGAAAVPAGTAAGVRPCRPGRLHPRRRARAAGLREVVAIWDGTASDGRDTTAHLVACTRSHGVDVEVLWPDGAGRVPGYEAQWS